MKTATKPRARATPAALGQMMATLRKRNRMSQRELARLSDISYTQIGALEQGQGGFPSPLTLRALAKGLASDDFQEQGYDPIKADAFYRQLMETSGYLGGLAGGGPVRRTNQDEVVGYLNQRTDDLDVAEMLVGLAERWQELEPEDQHVAKRLMAGWLKD